MALALKRVAWLTWLLCLKHYGFWLTKSKGTLEMHLSKILREERKEYLLQKLRLRHILVQPIEHLNEDLSKETMSFLAELHFASEKRFQDVETTSHATVREIMLERLFQCIYGPVFDVIENLEKQLGERPHR